MARFYFLLVRQNVKDASEDYRNLLLGFQYGGIPSINSLQSIYNFQVGTIILKVYTFEIKNIVSNKVFTF